MDNSQVINIAIFGLSLRLLHEMKAILEAVIPDDVYIQWTNITDPHLHWLLINDVFIESTNIQRLLQSKKIKLLKLTKAQISETDILHQFSTESMSKSHLRHWVIHNLYNMKVVEEPEQRKFHNLSEDLSYTDDNIKKLLASIVNPANGRIKLFDRDGEIGLCDLNTQWIWTDYPYRKTDQSLNYTHSTLVEILNQNAKQHHFKFWLWNLIWHSPELVIMPPEKGHLKLSIWPQPQLGQDHANIFRMAACFAQGSSITAVVERLKLPIGTVQHFVAACLATGFIAYQDLALTTELNVTDSTTPVHSSGIRSFFSGLRRRLGL